MYRQKTGRLAICSIVALLSVSAPAKPSPLDDYYRQLNSYFSQFSMLPFPVWQGQQIGDVVDSQDLAVLRDSKKCFTPGFEVRTAKQNSLPNTLEIQSSSGYLDAALNSLFGVTLNGKQVQKVILTFEDVTIETAIYGALKDNLTSSCPELKATFDRRQWARVDGRPATVILSVLKARPSVIIGVQIGAQADMRIENVKDLLKDRLAIVNVDPRLSAGASAEGLSLIGFTAAGQVTLAYQPASIPSSRLGAADGSEVEPFDPSNTVHLEMLKRLGSAWASQAISYQPIFKPTAR